MVGYEYRDSRPTPLSCTWKLKKQNCCLISLVHWESEQRGADLDEVEAGCIVVRREKQKILSATTGPSHTSSSSGQVSCCLS